MIFVTIGALFPFDRLIRVMDELAPGFAGETVFAQIGRGDYQPRNMPFARLLDAATFRAKLEACRLLVAHAGMGSVISAMEARRPIVVLPRVLELGEHTTDHQMATARWLEGRGGIHVAMDDAALGGMIAEALASPLDQGAIPSAAPAPFLARIRGFIDAA